MSESATTLPAGPVTQPVGGSWGRVLTRWDWGAFWVATIVAFAGYFLSISPSVSMEDCGELATGGDHLGVPHPPGYPVWTILAWIFAKVFSFVQFRGSPNPAWGIAMLSVVSGALAVGLSAMLISLSGRDMLKSIRAARGIIDKGLDDLIAFAGGVSGALMFAFTNVMWSQSNIVEVYSLNAFFVALILLLTYIWMRAPSDKVLFAIGLAWGLGMGDWWPTVLLTLGPLAILIMLKDMKLFRDFCAVGIAIVGMVGANVVLAGLSQTTLPQDPNRSMYPWAAGLLWSQGPYSTAFWVYTVINFAAIAAAWFLLPRGRTVAITFLLVELGLLIYLYMPLASDLRNPPMNWGYPRTWEGFMHAITRGQYEKFSPTHIFSKELVDQIGFYLTELRCQYTLPIALIGFFTFTAWSVNIGNRRFNAIIPAIFLGAAATVLVFVEEMGGPTSLFDIRFYMVCSLGVLGLLVLGGFALVLAELRDLGSRLGDKRDTPVMEKVIIGVVFLAGFILLLVMELNLIRLLVDPNAKLSEMGRLFVLVVMIAPFAMAGAVGWLMFAKPKLSFDMDQDSQRWIIATVIAFLLMSVLMVIGANPKGDIQDMFIQRVKFVSSHEVFGFWVGYGLILGLGAFYRFIGRFKVLEELAKPTGLVGCVVVLLLPAYPFVEDWPLVENSFNRDALRAYGGASANNCDFGWQFGNYQLQGMPAILKELRPDEPRPPNPDYPPPMGTNAIFFGGTDPGRFVPTYMIYCAHVREDVFLITQNALADHTYMSVMRDLYGDRIWIPSSADNAEAFRIFADDVKAGRRPGNVDMRSGRLIVQGVQQVMEINGILCKMIHDHNKAKTPFYVEESYVIPWMYPYMEPHGLILKINPEPSPSLSPEVVKNDMEFWKWYSARLLKNEEFVYDAVARKSFSKLRSAIAGLYEFRGGNLNKEAEIAYKQAVKLCPASPEANFRLAGLYMRMGKFDEAKRVMQMFGREDPNNNRVPDMIRQIVDRKQVFTRQRELETELNTGKAQLKSVMDLIDIYHRTGNQPGFMHLTKQVLDNPQLPFVVYLEVAKRYSEAKRYDDMDLAIKRFFERAPSNSPPTPPMYRNIAELYAKANKLPEACSVMQKYLTTAPLDVMSWHELGVMRIYLSRPEEAIQAFRQAVKIGQDKAREEIMRDPRIVEAFRKRPDFQQLLNGQR